MGDTTRPALAKTPEKVQEPAPAQKPKTQSKPQTPNKPKNEPTKSTQSDKPIFKIQFLTSDKKLPAGSKLFKGLTPVGHYQEKGIYKYTYGESHDYNKVLRTKRQISSKFKDAFIIAFKNGKKMNVNEAIKEFKNNR
jgi:N-acetylmuramoyl-L-alanine amidase